MAQKLTDPTNPDPEHCLIILQEWKTFGHFYHIFEGGDDEKRWLWCHPAHAGVPRPPAADDDRRRVTRAVSVDDVTQQQTYLVLVHLAQFLLLVAAHSLLYMVVEAQQAGSTTKVSVYAVTGAVSIDAMTHPAELEPEPDL